MQYACVSGRDYPPSRASVAEAKDCNSAEPSSSQSAARCADGTRWKIPISSQFVTTTPKKEIPAHYEEPPVMMVKCTRKHGELKAEEVLSESDASVDQQDFGEMSDCSISDVLYSKCSAVDHIGTFMKNVQVLLDAANYIENVERSSGSKWGKTARPAGGDFFFF